MRWTEDEIRYLTENYSKRMHIDDLVQHLKKSRRSIRHKAARLGFGRKGMLVKKRGDITPRNLVDKKYYLSHRVKVHARKMHRRQRIKQIAAKLLGGKCKICGYNRCLAALDFHHNSLEKDFNISELIKNSSEQNVLKEVQRCILVCANCHREIHNSGA